MRIYHVFKYQFRITTMQRILKILFNRSSCYKQVFIFSHGTINPICKPILKLSKNLQTKTIHSMQHFRTSTYTLLLKMSLLILLKVAYLLSPFAYNLVWSSDLYQCKLFTVCFLLCYLMQHFFITCTRGLLLNTTEYYRCLEYVVLALISLKKTLPRHRYSNSNS